MRRARIALMGAVFASCLFAVPASAVNMPPSYAPLPQWGGLPVIRVSCLPKCVTALKKCLAVCVPGGHGINCRQDCAHKKSDCEARCRK